MWNSIFDNWERNECGTKFENKHRNNSIDCTFETFPNWFTVRTICEPPFSAMARNNFVWTVDSLLLLWAYRRFAQLDGIRCWALISRYFNYLLTPRRMTTFVWRVQIAIMRLTSAFAESHRKHKIPHYHSISCAHSQPKPSIISAPRKDKFTLQFGKQSVSMNNNKNDLMSVPRATAKRADFSDGVKVTYLAFKILCTPSILHSTQRIAMSRTRERAQ